MFDNRAVTYGTGDLDVTGGKNLVYSISMNQAGKVICFQIQNESYMWTFVSAGTGKTISNVEDIAKEKMVRYNVNVKSVRLHRKILMEETHEKVSSTCTCSCYDLQPLRLRRDRDDGD